MLSSASTERHFVLRVPKFGAVLYRYKKTLLLVFKLPTFNEQLSLQIWFHRLVQWRMFLSMTLAFSNFDFSIANFTSYCVWMHQTHASTYLWVMRMLCPHKSSPWTMCVRQMVFRSIKWIMWNLSTYQFFSFSINVPIIFKIFPPTNISWEGIIWYWI